MRDTSCSYEDREQLLVSYIYGDIDPLDRERFEGHAAGCAECSRELADLKRVRTHLGRWTPPEVALGSGARDGRRPASATRRGWGRDMPAWAQVAAALLFVGVAAGIANVHVRYDRDGLTVRTGWRQPPTPSAPAPVLEAAPWRGDLAALEQQWRSELQNVAPASRVVKTLSDEEVMRRVRGLVVESEQRQQRELALRVAEVVRDVQAQRRADLVNIDRSLGMIQKDTGVEVMRQRQLINSLAVRVSQRQ